MKKLHFEDKRIIVSRRKRLNEIGIKPISCRIYKKEPTDQLSVSQYYVLFMANHAETKKAMHPFLGASPAFTLWDSEKDTAEIAFQI